MSKPFFLYGRQPVREFFRAAYDPALVRRAYLGENFPRDFRERYLSALPAGLLQTLPRRELDRIVDGANHQGVVLELARRPALALGWKDVFLEPGRGPVVVLDRIQDPHNLGSIIRSAEALGARAVFVTGKGASLSSPVVDRVSAGASLHLPVFEQGGLSGVLKFAREQGFWIVAAAAEEEPEGAPDAAREGAAPGPGKKNRKEPQRIDFKRITDLPDAGHIILLIGSEGEGLRSSLEAGADFVLGIPLLGRTASLNAGVAAAILIERLIQR